MFRKVRNGRASLDKTPLFLLLWGGMGGFVVAESQKTLCPHKLLALNWWSSRGTFQVVYDIAWPALKRDFSWQRCLGTWPNPGQVMWGSQLLLLLLALSCSICCMQLPCEMLCSLPCASLGARVPGAEGTPCPQRGQREQGCHGAQKSELVLWKGSTVSVFSCWQSPHCPRDCACKAAAPVAPKWGWQLWHLGTETSEQCHCCLLQSHL